VFEQVLCKSSFGNPTFRKVHSKLLEEKVGFGLSSSLLKLDLERATQWFLCGARTQFFPASKYDHNNSRALCTVLPRSFRLVLVGLLPAWVKRVASLQCGVELRF
jgi:hypothetical protein